MKYLIAIFLLFPFLITIIGFYILKMVGFSKSKALGFASDITTPLFIVGLPIIVKSVWEWNTTALLVGVLLVMATVFTYFEWRSQKEINIPLLLKKIWRAYFLLLSILYIVLMLVGFVYWIINYF